MEDQSGRRSDAQLMWLYRRKLEQWRRACQDEWNWGLMSAMRSMDRAIRERGSVAGGEWEFDRWFTAAHLFIICVRHVWRFSCLLGELLDSEEIRGAVKGFEEKVPHAKDMRDFLEHFDDYARGAGREKLPRPEDLGAMVWDDDTKELAYSFGGLDLVLRDALLASMDLADSVLARVPARGQD